MSFFSPITERSFSARVLYAAVYAILILGGATMLVPLLIAIAGSMSGPSERNAVSFYPKFLFHEEELWRRYLEARYGGSLDNWKMAWSDEALDFHSIPALPTEEGFKSLSMWREFQVEEEAIPFAKAGLAFTRATGRDVGLENDRFRTWLLEKYQGLEGVNRALLLEAAQPSAILPPLQNRVVLPDIATPFSKAFAEYVNSVRLPQRLIWDIGGFYRAVYLPRVFASISEYNRAFGTDYATFGQVPFPKTAPGAGRDSWFQFVHRILNVEFVDFTEEGRQAWQKSGLAKVDFLRTQALPEHIVIHSVDTRFAQWAKTHGESNARIPQRALDYLDFQENKNFWRWQFATQNFRYVIQEIVFYGNGVRNTFFLVVLCVAGALTVNPLAAYALSRFRLPQTYQILLFFLATIAFPAEVAMIPNFLQIKELGIINTFWALVLPSLVNGFSIFLLKGFFDSLPKELYEAADIDGASEWQIFFGITMRLSQPILAVLALGAFTSAYSAFMFALILAPDPKMWTLMVWIYQMQQSAGAGIVYASILLTALPTLAVYLCAQNIILRGIIVPSEK
jgi:multiple sugar transport system permease protein